MLKHLYNTPLGPLILIAHNGRIVYCNWDEPDCMPKLKKILRLFPAEITPGDKSAIHDATSQLNDYFSGSSQSFELPLELTGTSFQQKIWSELTKIPFGETISYRELAIRAGIPGASRAVANACGQNPIAVIIPCHRVISSMGEPGGYTGGLDKKLALLALESPTPPFKPLTHQL